ncbi:MAG: ribose 5-phosphate isomerase B [Dehalococcoidia bacterium]|nr:MAG: ribose 5-phosphate isomerase B [Dehalococcoidia bacterium]
MKERIVISSDHAGFDLKCHLKPFIEGLGYEVEDIGTFNKEPVDYPEYTFNAAQKVVSGQCSMGIVFCGTGQGDAMVANKVPGIRAALCWNEFTARMSRAHNNANMLVLGGWVTGYKVAEGIVRVWLATRFEGGRHERRIGQIGEIEKQMRLSRGKIYDITQTISPGMLSWPGEEIVAFNKVEYEGVSSLTHFVLSAHTGTHVDAQTHIISGGKGTDQLDLEQLTGLARVCHLQGGHSIDRTLLSNRSLDGVSRLLLRTSNSALLETAIFNKDYVSLTEDAAEYLVEKGIKFLALDYLSVDKFDTCMYPVHRILLNAGVVIVESVNLSSVPASDYEMLCLPLKLEGCDGAPARVILRTL